MFAEHTVIALTEPIALERIEDIPPDSPLLAADNPGDGLRPGDVGTIVAAFPGVAKFLVEFVEADGYTVALAEVKAAQARPATTADLAKDRFKRETAGLKIPVPPTDAPGLLTGRSCWRLGS